MITIVRQIEGSKSDQRRCPAFPRTMGSDNSIRSNSPKVGISMRDAPTIGASHATACQHRPASLADEAKYLYDYNATDHADVVVIGARGATYVYNAGTQITTETACPGHGFDDSAPLAKARTFWFSTAFSDQPTGPLHCEHRYDNQRVADWLSRDPIGENGGKNLYALVRNTPPNLVDTDGRESFGLHFDRNGNWAYPWGLPNPSPPPPSLLAQANEQFNEALSDWASGEGGGRTFGPDDAWTKELAKLPVYSRMRDEIRRRVKAACAGGTTDQLLNRSLNWSYSADDEPWYQPARDILNYVLGFELKSTESRKASFLITSVSCCPSEVCFDITVTDELRLGSATRDKGSSSSWLPDVPSGIIPFTNIDLRIPFESFLLRWNWTECLKFSF